MGGGGGRGSATSSSGVGGGVGVASIGLGVWIKEQVTMSTPTLDRIKQQKINEFKYGK